jgi:glutamate dehydrogenase (NAD(P)+)
VVAGKPLSLSGRRDSTGRGVFVCGRAAAAKIGLAIAGSRVCIQGFGNVGNAAARCFHADGAKVVALHLVGGGAASARLTAHRGIHRGMQAHS